MAFDFSPEMATEMRAADLLALFVAD